MKIKIIAERIERLHCFIDAPDEIFEDTRDRASHHQRRAVNNWIDENYKYFDWSDDPVDSHFDWLDWEHDWRVINEGAAS